MRISKLWPVFAVALGVLAVACGGGGSSSSPAPAAPTSTPTTAPATPGALQIAYTSNFGASSAATAAPAAIAFTAETQTVTVTATQANYTGSFTAAASSGCGTNVTVTPATSTTGTFTVTAANAVAAAANCSVSFTGATGTTSVGVGATVPAPGGVVLQWVANAAYNTLPAPITPLAGPISLIGVTNTFGAVLVVSETHYAGTFNAPVLSGGCGANLSAPTVATQGNIAGPQTALGQTQAYYNITAPSTAAAFALAAGCTITVKDNAATQNTSAAMGVLLTTSGGGIQ